MNKFLIGKKNFMLNRENFRIISGAMHYFRVPREYWRDRLLKIKAGGFNTIETYTVWNMHEPEEGRFDFSDMLDLKAYLDLINELGMYAIVRPGPYICSEWEFGGLPWWLLKYDDIELRCMNKRYIEKVDAYFDKLIPIISSCQIDSGGSVIMVQVENEYGSYGDDSEYIRYLAAGLRSRGITCSLFTADGDCDFMLRGGSVPEIFKTCNFWSKAESVFKKLRKFQPEGPLMCTEFWEGGFDHWGEKHHKRDAADAAEALKEILDCGGSFSVYMMHGGTNFGLMNGANHNDKEYQPTVNSYDNDALINEYGGLTEKYHMIKNLLADYEYKNDIEVSEPETAAYEPVKLNEKVDLFDSVDVLSQKFKSVLPDSMEKYDQGFGYILYETFITGPRESDELYINAHDRAYVYVDGVFKGIQYRNDKKNKIRIEIPEKGLRLSILVENMGRINYGPCLKDKKGLVEPVRLGQQFIYRWEIYTLPLNDISSLAFERNINPKFHKKPVFLRGGFSVEGKPRDTFIKCCGLKKGLIWINGRLLSRYWAIGPQSTAYIPAPFLHEGLNEAVVLECEGFKKPRLCFFDKPDLG